MSTRKPTTQAHSDLERVHSEVHKRIQFVLIPFAGLWVRDVDHAQARLPQVPPSRGLVSCARKDSADLLPRCAVLALDQIPLLRRLLEDGGKLGNIRVDCESEATSRTGTGTIVDGTHGMNLKISDRGKG